MTDLNQEDPTAVYLIIKSSLHMSIGKVVAQTTHAFDGLQINTDDYDTYCYDFEEVMNWVKSNKRIISLQASDKEFEKIKKEYPNCYVVLDAGLTEIPAGSETVIALYPQKKSKRTNTLKRLQALKNIEAELLEKITHILFEVQQPDPEHMIDCHAEDVNKDYLRLAKAIDNVLEITSAHFSKKY